MKKELMKLSEIAVDQAIQWLLHSGIQKDHTDGMVGAVASWYDPSLGRYSYLYPEITGYAVTKLLSSWRELENRAQIAFNLGRSANGAPFDLAMAYDQQIPENVRQNHDLIIIGLPMELAIITELRNALPAPFEERQQCRATDKPAGRVPVAGWGGAWLSGIA
jgi:hypothetical protein